MSYTFDFAALLDHASLLLDEAWTILVLAFWATLAGFGVRALCALGLTSGPRWLRFRARACVEVIGNAPFLVQAYFLISCIPAAAPGSAISAVKAGVRLNGYRGGSTRLPLMGIGAEVEQRLTDLIEAVGARRTAPGVAA